MKKGPEIFDVPEHLVSSNSDFISLLKVENNSYYAKLPNKGKGYEIEISETNFQEIKRLWDEDNIVLLFFNGGQIIHNNIVINSSVNITVEKNDEATFIN